MDAKALNLIAISAEGDLRIALNILETLHAIDQKQITVAAVQHFAQQQHFSYDRKATKHYDYLSAYSDSMAGSDTEIFEFQPLSDTDIEIALRRAVTDIYNLTDDQVDAKALNLIAISAEGDLRIALNILETLHAIDQKQITVAAVQHFAQQQHFSYDRKATKHYDYLSAYSDSMAGSDTEIFEFQPLSDTDIEIDLRRAVTDIYNLTVDQVDAKALNLIAISAEGDLRIALNILETLHAIDQKQITVAAVQHFAQIQNFSYTRKASKHYDYL
ncbi:hypothetical protein WP50_20030, partial [Lactiplantibacillus plantarum]